MQIRINWNEPVIPKVQVLQMQLVDLDDFYVTASGFDKTNIFFMLLTSFHHYLDQGERETAAHLGYLMACYLFRTLTPPGSCELAMHYINQAISLHPLVIYKEWAAQIQEGN